MKTEVTSMTMIDDTTLVERVVRQSNLSQE